MERHEAGTARVIPVILRPVDWRTAPFGKLQALPRDGRPVTRWSDKDEAFLDVARGIREVAESMGHGGTGRASSNPPRTSASASTTPTAPTPGLDRMALVRKIGGLSPPDFATVVTLIPGAAPQVSRHGTVPEQAAELIRWVESSAGPGLDVLRRALESF
jgi:hypothetical protein